MKLYKTTATRGDDTIAVSWQGSQTEASKARSGYKREGFHKPESRDMDVPVTKDALLEWLNKHVTV
jgi:hypothetical protein